MKSFTMEAMALRLPADPIWILKISFQFTPKAQNFSVPEERHFEKYIHDLTSKTLDFEMLKLENFSTG